MIGCMDCCCDVGSDDFNRSDSTNITTGSPIGWTEVAGDATIASNRLATTTSNTLCVSGLSVAGDSMVRVTVRHGSGSDISRVVLGYIDANNYLFAEFRVSTGGYLRLYQRASGSNTQLATVALTTTTTGVDYALTVCVRGQNFSIECASPNEVISARITPLGSSGYGLGLASGTIASGVEWDDFVATKTKDHCSRCDGCDIFDDTFTRSDSTSLGADWTEVAGDWSISSNDAAISSTGALLISTVPNPGGDAQLKITTNVTLPAAGCAARIIVDYVDNSNYTFAEIHRGAISVTPTSWLRIGQVIGGVETTLEKVYSPLGTWTAIQFVVCVDNFDGQPQISATFGTTITIPFTPLGGDLFGFGTGAAVSGTITFQGIAVDSTHTAACASCSPAICEGFCADGTYTDEVQIVIAGVTNNAGITCTGINGTYVVPRRHETCTEVCTYELAVSYSFGPGNGGINILRVKLANTTPGYGVGTTCHVQVFFGINLTTSNDPACNGRENHCKLSWEKSYASGLPLDCGALNISVPVTAAAGCGGPCGGSPTCTLTSV